MSIHPGCAHTRVTGLHYLNQSIVLFALPSSRAQLTSTVTSGPVCSFQNLCVFTTHLLPDTNERLHRCDVRYSKHYVVFMLIIALRHVYPSLPVVTSSRGTNEAAAICKCPLRPGNA